MHMQRKELIEAIVKLALVDLSPDLTVIDNKVRRVKLKENKIIKSKLTYRKKVSAYERNMK
jgi:uncharacterized protein (UPF0218 family)